MAKHVYIYPDCPICGKEMRRVSSTVVGSECPDSPWGEKEYWFRCYDCSLDTPRVTDPTKTVSVAMKFCRGKKYKEV